jgi:hypothetical protein
MIHVSAGMHPEPQHVVEQVRKLWSRDGGEWRLVLESIGGTGIAGRPTKKAEFGSRSRHTFISGMSKSTSASKPSYAASAASVGSPNRLHLNHSTK